MAYARMLAARGYRPIEIWIAAKEDGWPVLAADVDRICNDAVKKAREP